MNDGEQMFLTLLKQIAPDLPEPEQQYKFHPTRKWRFDFAWPCEYPDRGCGVAVEIDGGVWKIGGGRHGGDTDREKMNCAGALGWLVLHATPAMLKHDPISVIDCLRRVLSWRET